MGRRFAKSERLRLHAQDKSASAPTQSGIQSPPQIVQAQAEPQQVDYPDLQTQLETASRFGHKLTSISTQPNGNASNFPLIQPKLTIGAPGDKYEQEADLVAQQVVQQLNTPKQTVQRESAPEEEELQMQPEISQLQRQEVDVDEDEDEELQMKSEFQIQRQEMDADEDEDEELQMKPEFQIQRQEGDADEDEDEELQMKSLVQRRESVRGAEASTDLEAAIQQERGNGYALDKNLQRKMGQAMGADFSGVRVHTDTQSDELNQSIQAKAFTTKQDIFFRKGAYDPTTQTGQELIAHELTHVVQQNSAPAIQRTLQVGDQVITPQAALGIMQQNYPADVRQYGEILNQLLTSYDKQNRTFQTNEEMRNALVNDAGQSENDFVGEMEDLGNLELFQWGGDGFIDFVKWMRGEHEKELVGANCWTAVLYAAYKAGIVDKAYMLRAHAEDQQATEGSVLANSIAANATGQVVPGANMNFNGWDDKIAWYVDQVRAANIPRAKIITIGSHGAHVMLSIGGGRVLELNKQPRDFEKPNPNYDPNWKDKFGELYSKLSGLKRECEETQNELSQIKQENQQMEENDPKKEALAKKRVAAMRKLTALQKQVRDMEKEVTRFKGKVKEFSGAQDGIDVQYIMGMRPNEIAEKSLEEVLLGPLMERVQFDGIYWGALPLV
ncbi:DUF4157 domain-containing protein (plasmid) [Kovacikia minuta CCNUW1]|uniref:eCIS core domain-containing protein n=1 Tax=Kovacikia minuta TaxID=2931930 RepID=UPI001CCBA2BF|nr:DUF4157 domain-containing protein [Kovacikia minuta]UBF30543.1 DUF4157 domain-containing protein [Kovacikia minuta CCNUW1]